MSPNRGEHTDLRGFIASSPDAILIANPETGAIVEASHAAEEFFGYSWEELQSMDVLSLHPADEQERYEHLFETHFAQQPAVISQFDDGSLVFAVTADGEQIPVEINAWTIDNEAHDQPLFQGVFRDISTRIWRQRKLGQYGAAIEGSTDMLVAADRNRRILFANERFRELHGKSEGTIRGSHLREIVGKDVFEEIEPHFERGLGGEQGQFVREQSTDEDETRILDVHYYPLRGEEGDEITGVVASLRDITEREQRKRKLREFEQAVDAAGHAIYMTDSAGTITYANQAFEDITGYSPEDAIGQNPRILNSGEMSDGYFEELWNTITSDEIWEEEAINRRKNGELYHAHQTIAPVSNDAGGIEAYVAIQTDITEQKEWEERLSVYKRAIEGADELMAAIDDEYQYFFANDAYQEFHDLDLEEPPDLNLREGIGEEAFETAEPYIERAFNGETVTYRMVRTPEVGRDRTLSIQYSPLRNKSGAIWGVVATMRDLTEQIDRENHLRTLDRMLRHNLNNAMTVILGWVSVIEDEGSAEVTEYVEAIRAAGNQLLEHAAKEREIVEILTELPELTMIDLTHSIRSVTERLRDEYPEAAFELDLPAELQIQTTSEIGRAVEILLENAIVHSDETKPEIRTAVTEEPGRVTIEISDTNPPIPPEDVAVVTGDSPIDALTHSTGMGLWLVQRLVTRADGELLFERRDSEGNRITILLPT